MKLKATRRRGFGSWDSAIFADSGRFHQKKLGQFSQQELFVRFDVEKVEDMIFEGIKGNSLIDLLGIFIVFGFGL